ncbi:MAG: hypothetical protein ACREN6_14880 [Gemmatimonadaceae bacterium]
MPMHERMWRDGIVAGSLGAVGVAVWFFVVDLIGGHPLLTPELLGRAVLGVLGHGIENHGTAFFVVGYSVLHIAAFVVVGCIGSSLLVASRSVPQISVGIAFFFAVFEVGFYFFAIFLSERNILGALAWYQIGAANLVASALMGGYLLRLHPEFGGDLSHALDGTT